MDVWAVQVTVGGTGFHLLADEPGQDAARQLAGRLRRAATVRLRPRVAPAELGWDVPGGRELTAAEPTPVDRESPGSAWRDVKVPDLQDVTVERLDGPTPLWHWAVVDDATSGPPDAVG